MIEPTEPSKGYSFEGEIQSDSCGCGEQCECAYQAPSPFPPGMSPKLIEVILQSAKRKHNLNKKGKKKKR